MKENPNCSLMFSKLWLTKKCECFNSQKITFIVMQYFMHECLVSSTGAPYSNRLFKIDNLRIFITPTDADFFPFVLYVKGSICDNNK